jgi:hypothetical protein
MACLKVISARGIRVLAEGRDGNIRGKLPDERILGVDFRCNAQSQDDLTSLITEDGIMVGNVIKAVTTALGIKQCLACKGRQRAYNQRGLDLQRKVKRAILRS